MVTPSAKVLELQNVSRDEYFLTKAENTAFQTHGFFLKNFNEVLLRSYRERIAQKTLKLSRNWVYKDVIGELGTPISH